MASARCCTLLHMAALSAKGCNPAITTFARHLAGERPKVTGTTRMHKLPTIPDAIARDNAG